MKVKIEVDLRPKLSAIRDQGPRPTCLSHATTAAHEKRRGSATWLSPEYLHFFATGNTSSGATFAKIADTLKGKGQPVNADCPYLSTDPPSGWKPRARLRVFRQDSRESTGSSMSEIEQLIRGEQVPVLGIAITNGFFMPGSPWVLSSDGPLRGFHAVVGVGLGIFRANRAVLIRNSWGFDWADDGYAWLDANYISRHLKKLLVLTGEVI